MKFSKVLVLTTSLALSGCSSFGAKLNEFFDKKDNEVAALKAVATAGAAASQSEDDQGKAGADALKREVASSITNSVQTRLKTLAPAWDIEFTAGENAKPEVEVSTVRPIDGLTVDRTTTFWQGSLLNYNGGNITTLNLGLGQRYLSKDESLLAGINLFYDHEFPKNHQRASLGAELKSAAFELSANYYKAISKWKIGNNNQKERALNGYDLEIGGQIPFIPSAKVFLKQFKWDALQNAADLKGKAYSLELDHLLPGGFKLTAGRRDFDTGRDEDFAKLSYQIKIGEEQNDRQSKFFSNRMFSDASVANRRLEKVRRTNKIIKQTAGFTVSFR